jgi:hypothetical protein
MKPFLMITSLLITAFILFQWYTARSSAKSAGQPYEVIRKEKDFEIRFYPAVTMATIISSAKTYKTLGNSGFEKLAGYIFGKNDRNQKIAMTSPVHMDINDSISSMSFVMPAKYVQANLPKPSKVERYLAKQAILAKYAVNDPTVTSMEVHVTGVAKYLLNQENQPKPSRVARYVAKQAAMAALQKY